jgi:hypothetical protein
MDNFEWGRVPFDVVGYERRSREGPCFVCAILAGHCTLRLDDPVNDFVDRLVGGREEVGGPHPGVRT